MGAFSVSIFLSRAGRLNLSVFRRHVAHGNAPHAAVLIFRSRSAVPLLLVTSCTIVVHGVVSPMHFSVSIFLSRTDPPSPSQKVSKQNCRVCCGLCFAFCNRYNAALLSETFVRLRGERA